MTLIIERIGGDSVLQMGWPYRLRMKTRVAVDMYTFGGRVARLHCERVGWLVRRGGDEQAYVGCPPKAQCLTTILIRHRQRNETMLHLLMSGEGIDAKKEGGQDGGSMRTRTRREDVDLEMKQRD